MKKIFALFLVLGVSLFLFACGRGKNKNTTAFTTTLTSMTQRTTDGTTERSTERTTVITDGTTFDPNTGTGGTAGTNSTANSGLGTNEAGQ